MLFLQQRMNTKELFSLGQTIGLSGDELCKWVDAERARERDEKLAEREATKEKLDAEHALAECERERLALKQQTLHLKLRLAEIG